MSRKIVLLKTIDGVVVRKDIPPQHLDASIQEFLAKGVREIVDGVIHVYPANRIQRIEVYDEGSNTPQLSAERKAIATKPAGKRGGRKKTGSVVPGPGRTDGD